ncbi:MAG: hypothetical protein JO193_01145, partial [Candidatus Eremiobacteraeota bacterium]|nr:hypothetical protein [Candidatus Eremiobacteraeota bacterium]
YPWLHLRFWQPVSNQELILKLGFATSSGIREVTPGLEVAPNAPPESAAPPAWVAKATFPELAAPITIDGGTLSMPADQGWRELVFDLRRVAAYRAGTLRPRLSYITLKFKVTPSPELPIGVPRNLVFGFGDLAFVDAATSLKRKPAGNVLEIDGKPQKIADVTPLRGESDQFTLRFAPIALRVGNHRLATNLVMPWAVRSVTLTPPATRNAAPPRVTIRHIDDELFAVHVDRNRSVWLSFGETFHSGWRLIPSAAPRNRLQWTSSMRWLGPSMGHHVMGSAYNNMWFVDGNLPADFVIDFAPQDFALVGKVLSFVTILAALALAAYWWRR